MIRTIHHTVYKIAVFADRHMERLDKCQAFNDLVVAVAGAMVVYLTLFSLVVLFNLVI